MSKTIRSDITIAASAEQIWAILTDFSSYPQWNPFVQSISGDLSDGGRLVVRIVPPGEKGMTFKPIITELRQGAILEWLGHLIVPGIFDGRHRFELIGRSDGTTSFTQSEEFSGLIVPLFSAALENTQRGFEASNLALKERSEAAADVL
jgi:hypothetical protein